ncbi:prephenate dehydrogenase [Corynebacterium nuruki]|uniref:prephenate dehydrogenase n=1 Tax=Corynebacterium nuruki TaxID=1032851 RepID=UPI0002486D96|nr:prephenate dehydrogenase [Corynebacterium nuruki]
MNPQTTPAATPVTRPGPVCVLGLGLIGGCLLRDLVAAGVEAFGWNRSTPTVEAAAADGFDVSADLPAVLTRAARQDALVVLGVPFPALPAMLDALERYAPQVGFTDVTSVKGSVLTLVTDRGMADRFIGGHPMAGTADSGWEATAEGLFRGAVWVVTTDNAPAAVESPRDAAWLRNWRRVVETATLVGAAPVPARARKHDKAVARISHLPHVMAETMAITADNGGALSLSLAASSFRDATRVAGTEPDLVRAMCENNREALVTALDEALALMTGARDALAAGGDLTDFTEAGHDARLRFEARAGRVKGGPTTRSLIRVLPGSDGWLDQLHYAESIGAQIGVI